jgi:hypothetical protein
MLFSALLHPGQQDTEIDLAPYAQCQVEPVLTRRSPGLDPRQHILSSQACP